MSKYAVEVKLQSVERYLTGNESYQTMPVVHFLEEQNYVYIVINPLISRRAKISSLIDRFDAAKKLVAFTGVDSSVYFSGKFTASINRITKRGSSRLRHDLYMAIQSGIRDARK